MKGLAWCRLVAFFVVGVLSSPGAVSGEETFAPLGEDGKAPGDFEGLWAGYDPRAEPLEVEVLKAWEEDGVVVQVVRYRVGVFKGARAMAAAVYGFPKGAEGLPGLVQIHGGGQSADSRAVVTNAKRGYATISVAWAGRINAPEYRVGREQVELFWEGKTDDPQYRVTTDWGKLDGYHAPSRNPGNVFPKLMGAENWTLDPVVSPRNNGWFLCALAARRALTFLEQQPQVDPERLGVYGHSMGGKLTVMTTGSDDRVKAAAPSCGGMSDRRNADALFRGTIGDDPYLKRIDCPIVFLSPANDFHGKIDDLQLAVGEIGSEAWRVTCSAHHNHQDSAPYEVATQLWFDEHLKGTFRWPETPVAELQLKTADGVPTLTVRPDAGREVVGVDVFYTQVTGQGDRHLDVIHRPWHHAAPEEIDGAWVAALPLGADERGLWAFANVTYALDATVTGAGYYYGEYEAETFVVSSRLAIVGAEELKAAGVEVTASPGVVIESFEEGWEKNWFTYREHEWPRRTNRLSDPLWAAPEGARLALRVRAVEANVLVVGIDGYAAEVKLEGGDGWQEVVLEAGDFRNARGEALNGWDGVRGLRLGHQETLRERRPDETRKVGGAWTGAAPVFGRLWWETGG